MAMTPIRTGEFDRLVFALDEGIASADEVATLERVLEESAELRGRYLDLMSIEGGLAWGGVEFSATAMPARPRRRAIRWVAAVGALAASVALVVSFWPARQVDPIAPKGEWVRILEADQAEVVGVDGRAQVAAGGMTVTPGQTIRTPEDGGRALMEYPDGTRVTLGAGTTAAIGGRHADDRRDAPGKSLYLEQGIVQAVVLSQTDLAPLVVTTPHAIVRLAAASATCTSSAEETRVEMDDGQADLTRRVDGQRVALHVQEYVVSTRQAADPLTPLKLNRRVAIPRFHVRVSGSASALSPDGKRVATVAGGAITLWDATAGKEMFTLPKRDVRIESTAFSSDGRLLAAGSGDQVAIWDLAKREVTIAWKIDGPARRLAFAPDNRALAVVIDIPGLPPLTQIWNTANGMKEKSLPSREAGIEHLAFSPNGRELAIASTSRGLVVWDLSSNKERAVLKWTAKRDRVDAAAYSPDGDGLIFSQQGRSVIRLHDARTLVPLGSFMGQGRVFRTVAVSRDGRLIAAGTLDGTLFVWDRQTGEELVSDRLDQRPVRHLVFSLSGRDITAVTDGGNVVQYLLNVQ
jgi:hypothetical protein